MRDLTNGRISRVLIMFALPMIAGNLLQQVYNISDTLIVGRLLGAGALAAVGSAYTLMTFVYSVIIGLCMGCGAMFAVEFGAGHSTRLKEKAWLSFYLVAGVSVTIWILLYVLMDGILESLNIPAEVKPYMQEYTSSVFAGLGFVFIFNFFAYYLRAQGNSKTPLVFLAVSSVLNIILDVIMVVCFNRGIRGAAEATVVAQCVSAVGIVIYAGREFFRERPKLHITLSGIADIIRSCGFTCMQQSVMNFGILMIQGLVNSFGPVVMAAFAAAVKIDTIAYMPAQEFGNAYSMFISQNYGAGRKDRVSSGTKTAVLMSAAFCLAASFAVCFFASELMACFVDSRELEIISAGVNYLHIEGAFYFGIGVLFLLYGYFRGIKNAELSLVLTVISLGTRVLLAYTLSPYLGINIVWWAIPIGWILADIAGFALMHFKKIASRA